jgi:hypothetical protein
MVHIVLRQLIGFLYNGQVDGSQPERKKEKSAVKGKEGGDIALDRITKQNKASNKQAKHNAREAG